MCSWNRSKNVIITCSLCRCSHGCVAHFAFAAVCLCYSFLHRGLLARCLWFAFVFAFLCCSLFALSLQVVLHFCVVVCLRFRCWVRFAFGLHSVCLWFAFGLPSVCFRFAFRLAYGLPFCIVVCLRFAFVLPLCFVICLWFAFGLPSGLPTAKGRQTEGKP